MGWVLPEVQIRGPVEFGFLYQKFRFLNRILRLNETGLTFSSFGFGQVTTFRFQFEKLSKSGIHLRLFHQIAIFFLFCKQIERFWRKNDYFSPKRNFCLILFERLKYFDEQFDSFFFSSKRSKRNFCLNWLKVIEGFWPKKWIFFHYIFYM